MQRSMTVTWALEIWHVAEAKSFAWKPLETLRSNSSGRVSVCISWPIFRASTGFTAGWHLPMLFFLVFTCLREARSVSRFICSRYEIGILIRDYL